jgi:chemotaxis-related protein WspD
MSADPQTLQPPAQSLDPCWSEIGVYGNGSCAELPKFVHCRNCPVYSRAGAQLLDRPLLPEYRRERTADFAVQTGRPGSRRSSALLFRLAPEWFALPTQAFQEVGENRCIHSIPHRRDRCLLGLVNIRGELLICVDLAKFLGLERRTSNTTSDPVDAKSLPSRLLVANWDGQRLVFPVDEVHGIVRFEPGQLKEPPATLAKSNASFTQAMLLWNENPVGLLDPELLFSALNRSLA